MAQKYVLPDLIDEAAKVIDTPEDIFTADQHIKELSKYVEKKYIIVEHEPEEIVITAYYDYLINEIRGKDGFLKKRHVFNMDLLDAIETVVDKSDISKHQLQILKDYKLVKSKNDSKVYPNLACKNIYNIYLYRKGLKGIGKHQRKTERVNDTQLFVLLQCRTLYEYPIDNQYVASTLLYLQSINMVKPVVAHQLSDKNAFYIMTPLAQSYLRTTRRTVNYDISPFVYPVIKI